MSSEHQAPAFSYNSDRDNSPGCRTTLGKRRRLLNVTENPRVAEQHSRSGFVVTARTEAIEG